MNSNTQQGLRHVYRVRGASGQGACLAVQSVLQEHGLCGYTEWTSPEWSFTYLTHLEAAEVVNLLGGLSQRFKVQVQNGRSQSPLNINRPQ
jgi:hypothetical protein